jgi:Tol biopolymer transport system component
MATGQQAFKGMTSAVIFDAILHKAPTSPVRLNPDLPPDLERIINKALEKDRKLRYQSVADLRVDLERLKRDSTSAREAAIDEHLSSAPEKPKADTGKRLWGRWAAAITVIGFTALGIVLLTGRKHPSEPINLRVANAVKVTTATGVEDFPSWSRDGRTLAYQSEQAGNWDIWVTQVGSSQAVNRTADSPADDLGPTWSPDGQWIAFFSNREGGGYFVMPGVGGRPRKVFPWPSDGRNPTPVQWSPDSAQLAFALGQGVEPWFEILTLASGISRKLALPVRPNCNSIQEPNWSPDGRWLTYARGISPIAATQELWLTRTSDGESFQLTDGTKRELSPTWSPDSRGIYFVSDRGGTPDLWRLTIDEDGRAEGAPYQVTAGIEMTHAVLGASGKKLAYTKGRTVCNAFRAPLMTDRLATWADTSQLTYDEAAIESIAVSLDGRLLVSSDRSGNWDLYLMPASGGELQQLTTDPGVDAGPRWKPDGREIVFYSSRAEHREIWIMPIGGGPARQLTRGERESLYPAWSPDGLEIVKEENGLSVVPVQGGAVRQLTKESDGQPDWSPDGRWVAFDRLRDGMYRLWRVPASGGRAELLTKGEGTCPRWSNDGSRIYFIGAGEQVDNIWSLSMAGREERPVTALTGRRGWMADTSLAADGRFIYFAWKEARGDIWVADIIQPGDK